MVSIRKRGLRYVTLTRRGARLPTPNVEADFGELGPEPQARGGTKKVIL